MTPRSKKPKGKRNPHAVALAKLGAKKGADALNESLSPEQRKINARNAAKFRWDNMTPAERKAAIKKMHAGIRRRKKKKKTK
jgi:acyl-CoA reductase-like NAD-dependent aldehyde dehydrogenase